MHIKEDFFKSWEKGKEAMQRSLEKTLVSWEAREEEEEEEETSTNLSFYLLLLLRGKNS